MLRDVIFDKDATWNKKPILYFDDDIKKLDKVIVHIEIFDSKGLEMEVIQFVEDSEVDKITPIITRQADYEDEDLDVNYEKSEE